MADRTKGVVLIADGLGDRPVAEIGGLTPLEAATTPNLDRLAAAGQAGLMDPISPGTRAGSDTSHLAILGYDPYQVYTGRGPFEALGIGMEVRGGDICFRGNFTSISGELQLLPDGHLTGAVVTDRRAQRISEGTHELAQALNGMQIEDVTCYFKESVEHRAALVLRGPDLGANVTDVDPHHEGATPHAAEGADPASRRTAHIVNQFVVRSFRALNDHPVNQRRVADGKLPANVVLPRGAGLAPHLEAFSAKYGITGACVVETGLIAGIGRYLQMTVPHVEGATGGMDTDELALGRMVLKMLADHDFVLCNFKGPDLGGHDADVKSKMRAAEMFDNLVGYVWTDGPSDLHLAITADHCTPISFADHTGDPVPFAVVGPAVLSDGVRSFDERAVAGGAVGRIRGAHVMPIMTNLMGVQEKFGA
jgi:2,3-bisphosphoglycerate-independent phosphoglycerate mutase